MQKAGRSTHRSDKKTNDPGITPSRLTWPLPESRLPTAPTPQAFSREVFPGPWGLSGNTPPAGRRPWLEWNPAPSVSIYLTRIDPRAGRGIDAPAPDREGSPGSIPARKASSPEIPGRPRNRRPPTDTSAARDASLAPGLNAPTLSR